MCRRGQIAADAKVYTVPLLNWLGQYQRWGDDLKEGDSSVHKQTVRHPLLIIVECLATEVEGITTFQAAADVQFSEDVPEIVNQYLRYPLLLQAAELFEVELADILVSNGADVTATYSLGINKDGSTESTSTGINAIHAVLINSEPTTYMKMYVLQDHSHQMANSALFTPSGCFTQTKRRI